MKSTMAESRQRPLSSKSGPRSRFGTAPPSPQTSRKQVTPTVKSEGDETPAGIITAPRLPHPSPLGLSTVVAKHAPRPNGTTRTKPDSAYANTKAPTTSPLPLATIMDDDDPGWTRAGQQLRKTTKHPRRDSGNNAAGAAASRMRSSSPAYEQSVADPYITPVRSKSPGERNNIVGVEVDNTGDHSTASDSGSRKRKRASIGAQKGAQVQTTDGHDHNRRTSQLHKPRDQSTQSSRSEQKLPTSNSPLGHHRPSSVGREPPTSLPQPRSTPTVPVEGVENVPSDRLVGKVLLDRYNIKNINGVGNFSTCYNAFDTVEKKWVAIKRFFPQWAGIGTAEWHIVSDFKFSSRIVSAIECFWTEDDETDVFHIVMEPLCADKPIELPECVCDENHAPIACPRRHRALAKIMVQILSGLAEVHESDIIHADLTPSNMLSTMGSGMGVKLIDFSNAIRKEGWAGYEEDYGVQTPCYRAPEMLLGSGPVGKHIDIWSVGIIALQLLFGDDVFIPGGIEGGEIMRTPLEGRDAAIRRLIDVFGSVKSCEGGRYWLGDYVGLSTRWGWEKGKGKVRLSDQAGVLGGYLARTQDVGLAAWLTGMVEVDWNQRSTVEDALRNPWLVDTLLGNFGRVLMRPGPSRARVDHEEEEVRRRVRRRLSPEVRDFGTQAFSSSHGPPSPNAQHDKLHRDNWNSFSDDAEDLDDQVNLVGGG